MTPTQALLLYLHRFGNDGAPALEDELRRLVWEQPANLDRRETWEGNSVLRGQDPDRM